MLPNTMNDEHAVLTQGDIRKLKEIARQHVIYHKVFSLQMRAARDSEDEEGIGLRYPPSMCYHLTRHGRWLSARTKFHVAAVHVSDEGMNRKHYPRRSRARRKARWTRGFKLRLSCQKRWRTSRVRVSSFFQGYGVNASELIACTSISLV